MKKQKFIEVHSDYQDPETGNIAIDAYLTTDDETQGVPYAGSPQTGK